MKLTAFSLFLLSFFSVNAQTKSFEYNILWSKATQRCVPCDVDSESEKIISVQTKLLSIKGDFDFNYEVTSIDYENIVLPSNVKKTSIANSSNLEVYFGKSGVDNYMTLKMNPIFTQNGNTKIVKKIKIIVNYESNLGPQNKTATYAPESVLKNGNWFKFGVNKSGVYKLDKADLDAAGVSTSSINPQHINIYANHMTELPELNSAYHPDDLVKNSIFIQGESDGVFNQNDYVLFYATGPDVETNDTGNGFKLSTNNNDSLSYFYLKIDGTEPPKRINAISNSTFPITNNVTSSNAVVFHELDEQNLISSGTNWLGEVFDIEMSHSFSVNLPGLLTSSAINIESSLATKTKVGTSSFDVLVNGDIVNNAIGTLNSSAYTKAVMEVTSNSFFSANDNFDVVINFNRSNPSTIGWLNKVILNYRRNLSLANGQFLCRDWNSVGSSNVSNFNISGANGSTLIWDVTDPTNSSKINGTLSGANLTFTQETDSLRAFAVFNSSQAFIPIFIGAVANQNLHALSQVDYLIVTHELFTGQANRLAALHEARGLSVHVVEIQQLYNEYSCGMADPVSIRWFVKMFYDRAILNGSTTPKSLLLFGDGSYDALNRFDDNTALLPAYRSRDNESDNSQVSYINSFTSDDFFGMLDDLESMAASDLIDVGIGRFPVNTVEEATAVVNKIQHYMEYGSYLYPSVTGTADNGGYNSTFGDWRARTVLIADDENGSQFVDDCEILSDSIQLKHNEINVIKLYLDAYQQVITSGGERYPEVEDALNQYINQGALVFNYVGHGGETGLSLERIVSIPMIEEWTNIHKLPLFISATCEFSRFDDPNRTSAGEIMLLSPNGGAVSLLTTTRLVYITTNSTLVKNLYSVLFDEVNGQPLSMGEIIRQSKNLTAGDNNMRNFTLLGDPALLLGRPKPNVITDSINGVDIIGAIDTMKALTLITISGHVEDYTGGQLPSYSGIVYPTVYDKIKIRSTLSNDGALESPLRSFDVQNNIIYKGKSTVSGGKFTFSFVVPKDIDYAFGKSKISYYSENGVTDKTGYDTTIVIGGIDPNGIQDDIGPEIELYMNDENFANGGLTDTKPLFIAKVTDENGVNTSGNGIGHDITLIIDGNTASPIILNNYYEADLDTYKSGEVNFQFIDLEEGQHQLEFKIWDVNNNSSEATLDFIVVKKENITISHLLNYPNPFTTRTEFFFEHNQVFNNLEAKIDIFTVSGKLVKTIFQNVNTFAFRSEGIPWDGRDEYGDKLARGVYVYRLSIETPDGEKANKIEKLVIL
jgi:hypothetical protein